MKVLDLSQPLGEQTVLWPGSMPFRADGPPAHGEDGYWARDLHLPEHSGTHLDAPVHCVPGGAAVADIPAERRVRPAVRIDARDLCGGDPSWTLGAGDVTAWEAEHGAIAAGAGVLLCTGWDAHLGDPDRYRGEGLDYPGYGGDAAALLVARGVAGIGIDTLGVDSGRNADASPVHRTTLPAGLWHLEGLVGLAAVPPTGATLVVGVPKLVGGSGMPARVLALVP